MINISHLYAYYKRYEDLEKAMDDGIVLLESSEGETVLQMLLSQNKRGLLVRMIKHLIRSAGNQKESTLNQIEVHSVFRIYRQFEQILTDLNLAQLPELIEIYEALLLKIEIEPLQIEKTQTYSDSSYEFSRDKIKEGNIPSEKAVYEVSAVRLDLALATERTQKNVESLINLKD